MPEQDIVAELGRSYIDLYNLFRDTIIRIDKESDRENIDVITAAVHETLSDPKCTALIDYLIKAYDL